MLGGTPYNTGATFFLPMWRDIAPASNNSHGCEMLYGVTQIRPNSELESSWVNTSFQVSPLLMSPLDMNGSTDCRMYGSQRLSASAICLLVLPDQLRNTF